MTTCTDCGTHLNVRLFRGLVMCVPCRARRNREGNRISTLTGPTEDGRLKVSCWCEMAFVLVPIDEVHAGRTGSCGRVSCRESVAA